MPPTQTAVELLSLNKMHTSSGELCKEGLQMPPTQTAVEAAQPEQNAQVTSPMTEYFFEDVSMAWTMTHLST